MRKIAYLAMTCALSAFCVTAQAADTDTESAAAETIPAYTVHFSGGGWGASGKARAALSGLEGANKVLVSGTFALVTIDPETTFTRSEIRKHFKPKGLKLEKLSKGDVVKPTACVRYVGKGGGWADKVERARAALAKLDGVSFALISSRSVELLLENGEYDKEEVAKVLKRAKFEVSSEEKMSALPL